LTATCGAGGWVAPLARSNGAFADDGFWHEAAMAFDHPGGLMKYTSAPNTEAGRTR
jgi:hypothetical protein